MWGPFTNLNSHSILAVIFQPHPLGFSLRRKEAREMRLTIFCMDIFMTTLLRNPVFTQRLLWGADGVS